MRTVSATGEGVNDVEALVSAQVGLAMGDGCSSAKENCEMVLVDNNFSSVIAAVQWGRNIF
jgi:P-type E1-E2 ATPase